MRTRLIEREQKLKILKKEKKICCVDDVNILSDVAFLEKKKSLLITYIIKLYNFNNHVHIN